MLFKKGELKLLGLFYFYNLIYGFSMMVEPFIVIYFLSLNFSFFQIGAIVAAYSISAVIFEIPTGALADGLSRKFSVVLGFFITASAVIFIPFFSSFRMLLLLWVIAGLGLTFVSGAEEAWVIDNLNKSKRKDLHQEFFIKNQMLCNIGIVLAPLIGALIVKVYSISILWIVMGIGLIIDALILWIWGKELYRPQKVKIWETIKRTYQNSRAGLKFSRQHKIVFYLILGSIFASFMFMSNSGWQPLMLELTMPTYALGIMYSVVAIITVISSIWSRKLSGMKLKRVMFVSIGIQILLFLSLLLINPPFYFLAAIVFIIVHSLANFNQPFLKTYLHKFVPEKIRATVVSVQSMAKQLFAAIAILIVGLLLDAFGPKKVLAYWGLFGIIAIICYLKIKE